MDRLDIWVHDYGPRSSRHRPEVIDHDGDGLMGMRERAATHRGHVDARPCGDGFRVTATLPLREGAPV